MIYKLFDILRLEHSFILDEDGSKTVKFYLYELN